MRDVIAAAVFMYTRASVESRRIYIDGAAIAGAANDYLAAALGGTAFDPINVIAIHLDLAQADGSFDNQIRRNWRFPRAVWSTLNQSHLWIFRVAGWES